MKFDSDNDDGFMNSLIFEIEMLIFDYDDAAHSRDIRLTDSNVKSALSKVKKNLIGGIPGFSDSKEKEKMITFMAKAIIKMIPEDDGSGVVPARSKWLRAIAKIENSIKLHKVPAGREYLDFLKKFIPNFMQKSEELSRRDQQVSLDSEAPCCGLCGATENLTKTECCDNWICDDEDQYVAFSYSKNSCKRNHRRFTLCGGHHEEGHSGDWKTCKKCRDNYGDDLEMYAHFGTNEYNFEILKDLPTFESKRCSNCSKVIRQGSEGYSAGPGGTYTCDNCSNLEMPDFTQQESTNKNREEKNNCSSVDMDIDVDDIDFAEEFRSHPELYQDKFCMYDVIDKLWGEKYPNFLFEAEVDLNEYLQESPEFVEILCDDKISSYFHYLPACFDDKEFCIKPTEQEIKEGILFPGHRFIPYASSEIFPGNIELYDEAKQVKTKVVKKTLNELSTYHLLFGDAGMIEYFMDDDIDNVPDLHSPLQPQDIFKVTVMNMKKFYKKHNFKPGDTILMYVESFIEGVFSMRYRSKAELSEEKGTILKWCTLFTEGIEKAIDDYNPGMSLEKEVAIALILNGDFLLNNPVIHLGGWLGMTKKIRIKPLMDKSILWNKDSEPESPDDKNLFDDMDFDDVLNRMEKNMSEKPDPDSMDGIMKYMGFEFVEDEIEAYMRDELFGGGNSWENVWARCLDSRIEEEPNLEAYKLDLKTLFNKLWEKVAGTYNRFADDRYGKLRNKVLKIRDHQIAWMRNLGEFIEDLSLFNEAEFLELAKISIMIFDMTLMLNDVDESVSKKELKQFNKILDAISLTMNKLQKEVEMKL